MNELTDQDHAAAAEWLPLIQERLGITDALDDLETVEPTECADCTKDGHLTDATYVYGNLILCGPCARARRRVAVTLGYWPPTEPELATVAAAEDDLPF